MIRLVSSLMIFMSSFSWSLLSAIVIKLFCVILHYEIDTAALFFYAFVFNAALRAVSEACEFFVKFEKEVIV